MIRFRHSGDFKHTEAFFRKASNMNYRVLLEQYGQAGAEALASATPVDSGKTAASWGYEIEETPGGVSIYWTNSNIQDGVNIAVILQFGHGTGTGGYVRGIDYINPALRPIFEQIADKAWKEVTSA